MSDKIIVDLDNTITINDENDYSNKTANNSLIRAIRSAKKLNKITIFSSRNMRTFNGDLKKINQITKPIAIKWLKNNNVDFDDIIFGKPWAGDNGWYVDDRNLSLEEFIFKFDGPFADSNFDIVIPCFNEEKNIKKVFYDIIKLERLLNVDNFIFVDNGSSDNTNQEISRLKKINKKLKLITVKDNKGYGFGIKQGLLESSSDYVLLNHADLQFDAYSFLYSNLEKIKKVDSIIPIRLNRPVLDRLFSFLLRLFMGILNLSLISDFNGQPKIFKLSKIKSFDQMPDDFCFDYYIYKYFENNLQKLPVIQLERNEGNSSWKGSIFRTFRIFLRYIYFSITLKRN